MCVGLKGVWCWWERRGGTDGEGRVGRRGGEQGEEVHIRIEGVLEDFLRVKQ